MIRILFAVNDFKTDLWAAGLKKYKCKVVPAGLRLHSHLHVLLAGFFWGRRIHAFVFRYLNDRKSFSKSVKFFFRDVMVILVCKLLGTKVIWLLHNIDEETLHFYPSLSKLRRKIVGKAAEKILVTDPHLVEVARRHGIEPGKLDWTCFGAPVKREPDLKNIRLKEEISRFRQSLSGFGYSEISLGLCVSETAKKKNHFLYADRIVGPAENDQNTCVGLVLIGRFPEESRFARAKERVLASPYILFIEESFAVNEHYISDQIDFIYRSLTDQSVAYTLYVAASVEKPLITHNTGALPLIVEREGLGVVIPVNERNFPGRIVQFIPSWSPKGARDFLAKRTWTIGADRIIKTVTKYPILSEYGGKKPEVLHREDQIPVK